MQPLLFPTRPLVTSREIEALSAPPLLRRDRKTVLSTPADESANLLGKRLRLAQSADR